MPRDAVQTQIDRELQRFGSIRPASTLPVIPRPAPDVASLQKSVLAIKGAIDAMLGAGSVADRAITVNDLIPPGQTSIQLPDYTFAGGASGGGGGGGDLGYVDPRPVLATPPTLTDFTVSGAVENIIIDWSRTAYRNHAYVEIWRHTADNLAGATLHGTTIADVYVDSSATYGVTYYYWGRAALYRESDGAVVFGAYNDVSGTPGARALDVPLVLDALTGEIRDSHLYEALGSPIRKIIGNDDALAADALAAAVAAHQEAQQRAADLLAEAAQRGTDIRTTQVLIDEGDAQLAQQITTLTAVVETNQTAALAAVETEAIARAAADAAEAALRETLATSVAANTAAITSEATARATADSALAADITTLQADVGANTAAITSEATARASADAALASDITLLEADVAGNAAAILTESATRASADAALASDITLIQADVADNAAAILSESAARASADTALASDITLIQADVADNAAAILSESTARASADSALASDITTLQADVGGNTAAISAEATARAALDGSVQALYTVRAEVAAGGRTVVGGFGLAATSTAAGGATIDFAVRADRFYVAPPSGTAVAEMIPFVVQASPTTINGVAVPAGTYINDAYIRNGTITNAKIGNAAVDTAKIADAAIVSAKIGDGEITTAKIEDATITSAKIVSVLATQVEASALSAITANLGTITAGNITLDSSGFIRGGATSYGSTGGFWLGYSGGAYKFSISNKLLFDGTNLTFSGALSAASGTFAGSLSAATGTFAGTLTAGAINAVDTINMKGQSISANYLTTVAEILKSSGGTSQLIVLGTDGLQSSLVSFSYGALETFIVVNANSKLGTTNARWLDIEITPTLVDSGGTLVSTGFASKIRVYAIPTAGTQQFFGAAHSEVFSGMGAGTYRVRFSVSVTCRAGDDSLQNNLTELAVTARILLINRKV